MVSWNFRHQIIDANAGVTAQDRMIAGLIQQAKKPCVVW